MRISLKILVGISVLILAFYPNRLLSTEKRTLIIKDFFPKEDKDKEYKAYTDIELYNGLFFIVENIPGFRLLSFKKSGDLVSIMGKKGKKPEEFSAPIELSVWGNEIFVKDDSGLSLYGTDGKFRRRIRPFINIVSFVVVKDRISILCGTPGQKALIHVFSPTGKYLAEFGEEFVKLDYGLYKSMSPIHAKGYIYEGKILSDGKSLYYLNSSFGKAMRFTLHGQKTLDKDIVDAFGEEGQKILEANTKLWLKEGIDLKATQGRIYRRELFHDAYLCGDRIYVLVKNWRPGEKGFQDKILVLDKNSFALLEEDTIQKAEGESVMALCIEETDNDIVFYFTLSREKAGTVIAQYRRGI